MSVFECVAFDDHEQVVFCSDQDSGLRAIIAIHDTTLGPALGGCRFWSYTSEADAVEDVLRLSRGMTYKAAMAHLPLGGGKSVVLGDPERIKSRELLLALGTAVERLGGRYIVAEDVGTTAEDMAVVRRVTRHVSGLAGPGGAGDPGPMTALGVLTGIRATVRHKLGRSSLQDVHVAVQGLGSVGYRLCRLLHGEGARLTVTDIDPGRVGRAAKELSATPCTPEAIFDVEADVFAPCALGAILDDGTISRLRVRIVAGSANNQLAEDRHGEALADRGVLYAPDYVINAGGLISVGREALGRDGSGFDRERVLAEVTRIGETLHEVFDRAGLDRLPTNVVADRIAQERLAAAALPEPAIAQPATG